MKSSKGPQIMNLFALVTSHSSSRTRGDPTGASSTSTTPFGLAAYRSAMKGQSVKSMPEPR